MKNKLFFVIGLIVLAVIFGPFCVIWALNSLFPALVVQYSWTNWLAVNVLSIALKEGTHFKAQFKANIDE